MKGETVDIEMMIHAITDKAVLASTDGDESNSVWLPKSQCAFEQDPVKGKAQIITMAESLAYRKDIA
jgi:hypothetical protein